MTHIKLIRGLTVLPLLLAAASLTACSNSSASPGVAALGTTSASASSTPTLSAYQASLAYAKCIRSHGVPGFPDPQQSGGGLSLGSGSGFDPESPAFQAAMTACQSLSPRANGAAPGAPFDPTKIAAWTTCLRAHGMAKIPDPTNQGNGVSVNLTGTGIDQTTVHTAFAACTSQSPGGEIGTVDGSQ